MEQPRLLADVPGPSLTTFARQWTHHRGDMLRLVSEDFDHYGSTYRLPLYGQMLVSRSSDVAREVLVTQMRVFEKTRFVKLFSEHLGEGLVTLDGAEWRRHRQPLNRAMGPAAAKALLAKMGPVLDRRLGRLETWTEGGRFNGYPTMKRLVLDMTATAMLALEQDDQELVLNATALFFERIEGLSGSIAALRWLQPARELRYRALSRAMNDRLRSLIQERRAEGALGDDLIRLMLGLRDKDGSPTFTDQEIRDEAVTFVCAGFETTSGALTWALLHCCLQPELQEALASEILAQCPDGCVSLSDLAHMPTVTEVFLEALRMYPPTWAIARQATEATVVQGIEVPAGTYVLLALHALHHHADYWPDPETFRPERFRHGMKQYADIYLPFISGGRACIGKQLAIHQGSLVLANLLGRYRLTVEANQSYRPRVHAMIAPPKSLWMRYAPRTSTATQPALKA